MTVLASATLIAFVVLVAWPWRVEATLKAISNADQISLAGGVEIAGLSGSAAAILGGPGVIAVHLRARELWRRSVAEVSIDALFAWLDEPSPPVAPAGVAAQLARRVKDALRARTDIGSLPELGLEVFLGLRDVSLRGDLRCGFSDPVLTGKTAAWLFPIAGVLAPFGTLDVSMDWSGRNVLDGAIELSFRVVPARVALEGLRFARHHVHLRRKGASSSSTLPASSTT